MPENMILSEAIKKYPELLKEVVGFVYYKESRDGNLAEAIFQFKGDGNYRSNKIKEIKI